MYVSVNGGVEIMVCVCQRMLVWRLWCVCVNNCWCGGYSVCVSVNVAVEIVMWCVCVSTNADVETVVCVSTNADVETVVCVCQ